MPHDAISLHRSFNLMFSRQLGKGQITGFYLGSKGIETGFPHFNSWSISDFLLHYVKSFKVLIVCLAVYIKSLLFIWMHIYFCTYWCETLKSSV